MENNHKPTPEFSPLELHLICVVLANHADELRQIARMPHTAPNVKESTRAYAAQLDVIADKANIQRKPPHGG